jgi:hypothetical protein
MPDRQLEHALRTLPLDWPEAPDLADRLRLPERAARARRPRWVLAVALALAALLAATLAVPQSRSAFLRILHLGGEEIHLVDELPPVSPRVDLEVALGRRTTLEQARRQASFELRVPDEAPDRVYVGEQDAVTLLYGTPTRVRALITESRGLVIQKLFAKSVTPGTRIEYLRVNGGEGGFISGAAHEVYMLGSDGYPRPLTLRLARNVLLWSAGGIAYRIEGDLTKQEALDLAAQLR